MRRYVTVAGDVAQNSRGLAPAPLRGWWGAKERRGARAARGEWGDDRASQKLGLSWGVFPTAIRFCFRAGAQCPATGPGGGTGKTTKRAKIVSKANHPTVSCA